ncbi:TPA: hypothetical protein MB359_001276 [Klebsiella variicola subsp. variicola]|nr:hypothetical protein [Klebsiella variicola subsp. variicola]HBZ7730108.1 hypothetical protein [Klebsiella variicola subsp. variicola]
MRAGRWNHRCCAERRLGVCLAARGTFATGKAFGCRMAAFGMIWNIDYVIHPEG